MKLFARFRAPCPPGMSGSYPQVVVVAMWKLCALSLASMASGGLWCTPYNFWCASHGASALCTEDTSPHCLEEEMSKMLGTKDSWMALLQWPNQHQRLVGETRSMAMELGGLE